MNMMMINGGVNSFMFHRIGEMTNNTEIMIRSEKWTISRNARNAGGA